ncbi:MAG: sigma-54 dependent transcriptional regulator [bacterium]|nr:sigma-54 dependent transcriptional regulator [bacterium]
MANILIIDDDEMMCDLLSQMVARQGHQAACARNLKTGVAEASSGRFDVVFLDVRLPDGNGLEGLAQIKKVPKAPEVIIITGASDPDGAELAIKNGAWDYIQKPATIKEMTLPFLRALQYREEKRAQKPALALEREGIVGESPQLKACLDRLAQAASSEVDVLITGETGTGKELFASAIHRNSARAKESFIVIDCTALPENLVESVLFGHEKGSFTGADRSREGLVAQADGGTLFLDEIGELPLSIQKTFLRVLQEHRFRPIGSKREITSDFRLVSATNRDLEAMVKAGQFREDLLFRIESFVIKLPPLREHPLDIKDLAIHYMNRLCERNGIDTKGFSPEFFQVLSAYSWPGNVRELFHTLDQVFTVAQNQPTLFPQHLPDQLRIQLARASVRKEPPAPEVSPAAPAKLRDYRDALVTEAEKSYLQRLMTTTQGNIEEACRISGLSRPRLYALLKKYNLGKK